MRTCRCASLRNRSACRAPRRIGISLTGARCSRLLPPMALTGLRRFTATPREGPRKPELAAAGRGYLAFAAERPQMFRLMFVSDLLGGSAAPPDPALIKAASESYVVFEQLVAATLDNPDEGAVKSAAIAIMSTSYGFALLRMNDRLKPFMYGPLTQSELVDAVLSIKVAARPGIGRKARQKA